MSSSASLRSYKNTGKTMDHLKNKRREGAVQIRKHHRAEQLLKRRNIVLEDLNTSPLKEINSEYSTSTGISMNFEEIVQGIFCDSDKEKQFLCTQNARKILSRERHPPINKMIEANIIPKLVTFLKWDDNPQMQFEAAWALTNIASGNSEQTCAVVHGGAVPNLIEMLSHSAMNVVEQAVWALGNIAGDGAPMRDYLLDKGIVKPLIALVKDDAQVSFLQNLTWTISNLCRNKNPHTSLPYVVQLLPTIVKLVNCVDKQVRTDACWALSYITDGPNERIELVIKTGVVETLVHILSSIQDVLVITPVLRTLGNIVTGTDQQTQLVIDLGVLRVFSQLLHHEKQTIQKEAAWTLSNITAGTQIQIQAVIDANVMPRIVELLSHGDYKTQKEACWTVTNFTSGASLEQLYYLMNLGAVPGLCGMLASKETKILHVCLDGISNLLITAEKMNKRDELCDVIEECEGIDKIEKLQQHENETVYSMALHIIDRFFAEEDQEHEELAPGAVNGEFQFTAQPATTQYTL
nr:importin subunit alpha-1-like [Styela clava]